MYVQYLTSADGREVFTLWPATINWLLEPAGQGKMAGVLVWVDESDSVGEQHIIQDRDMYSG